MWIDNDEWWGAVMFPNDWDNATTTKNVTNICMREIRAKKKNQMENGM